MDRSETGSKSIAVQRPEREFRCRLDLFRFALDKNLYRDQRRHGELLRLTEREDAEAGLYCEFGVGDGITIRQLAELRPDRIFHGFDSFFGLPEDGGRNEWKKGSFTRNGVPPLVPPNVQLHIGMFAETIPPFLKEHPEPIAFLHIDCDLYSSTKTVLTLMAPRIQPGTLIQFDEYLLTNSGDEPWEPLAEAKAFWEFREETGKEAECIGWVGEQVLFRMVR